MDHENLIAIDIHTHAEVSCWNPFDNYGEEYDRAADKYFRSNRRPTIAETIVPSMPQKKMARRPSGKTWLPKRGNAAKRSRGSGLESRPGVK